MKVLLSSLLLFGVLANNLPFYGEDLKSSCDVVQSEHSKKMEGKHTRERKIKKEFTVGASDELEIDNSYGNVDITTWNENRVVIEVTIKTNGDDEDKVEDRLRAIDVDFNQTSGGVRSMGGAEVRRSPGSTKSRPVTSESMGSRGPTSSMASSSTASTCSSRSSPARCRAPG